MCFSKEGGKLANAKPLPSPESFDGVGTPFSVVMMMRRNCMKRKRVYPSGQ
jgi:hypothetical protein